jgi:hypothetical protein
MLASDIITRVRDLLGDEVAPYRWTDTKLLLWLTDAQRDLAMRRPDSLYLTSVTTTQPGVVAALGDTLVVADHFIGALVDFVCFRAFMRDNEDPINAAKSSAHFQTYLAEIS